jgi:hypothetical protein
MLAEERNHVGVELVVERNAILEALARGRKCMENPAPIAKKSEN